MDIVTYTTTADGTSNPVNVLPDGGGALETAFVDLTLRIEHTGQINHGVDLNVILRARLLEYPALPNLDGFYNDGANFRVTGSTAQRRERVPSAASIRDAVVASTEQIEGFPVGVIADSVIANNIEVTFNNNGLVRTVDGNRYTTTDNISGVNIGGFQFTGPRDTRYADVQSKVGDVIRGPEFTFEDDNAVVITSSTPVWLMPDVEANFQSAMHNFVINPANRPDLGNLHADFSVSADDFAIAFGDNDSVTLTGDVNISTDGPLTPPNSDEFNPYLKNVLYGMIVDHNNNSLLNPIATFTGVVKSDIVVSSTPAALPFPPPGADNWVMPELADIEELLKWSRPGDTSADPTLGHAQFTRPVPRRIGIVTANNVTTENIGNFPANDPTHAGQQRWANRNFHDFRDPAFSRDVAVLRDGDGNVTSFLIRVPLGASSRRRLTEMPQHQQHTAIMAAQNIRLGWQLSGTLSTTQAIRDAQRRAAINHVLPRANLSWTGTSQMPDDTPYMRIYQIFRRPTMSGTTIIGWTNEIGAIRWTDFTLNTATNTISIQSDVLYRGWDITDAQMPVPAGGWGRPAGHGFTTNTNNANVRRGDNAPMGGPFQDIITLYFWPRGNETLPLNTNRPAN